MGRRWNFAGCHGERVDRIEPLSRRLHRASLCPSPGRRRRKTGANVGSLSVLFTGPASLGYGCYACQASHSCMAHMQAYNGNSATTQHIQGNFKDIMELGEERPSPRPIPPENVTGSSFGTFLWSHENRFSVFLLTNQLNPKKNNFPHPRCHRNVSLVASDC